MKSTPFFCICCWAFISCNTNTKQKNLQTGVDSTYTITGQINGLDSGWVYLVNREEGGSPVDSALIINGNFVFKGKAPEPEFYKLGIPNNGNREFRVGFFIENGQMHISGNRDTLWNAVVTGSPSQDEYVKFRNGHKYLEEASEKLERSYDRAQAGKNKSLGDSLERAFKILDKKDKDYVKQYARQHPSSYISAMMVYQKFSYNFDPAELDSIYRILDPAIRHAFFGRKIKAALDIARLTAVGKPALDFVQNDVSGTPVSLSSFKGKLLLLDFWASWCGPCRMANPAIVKAYRKYHAKGFDILSVSLDSDKNKWVAAIKKDNLHWTQVSDLKGWQNNVAVLYGIQAIPMSFLLDKEGKIIARGLNAAELKKKLAETLK